MVSKMYSKPGVELYIFRSILAANLVQRSVCVMGREKNMNIYIYIYIYISLSDIQLECSFRHVDRFEHCRNLSL